MKHADPEIVQVRDPLPVTPRTALKASSSINLHSSWGAPWNDGARVNQALVDGAIGLGVGFVRDSLSPRSDNQRIWHQQLADAGILLHLNVTDHRRAYIDQDVAYLATLPYAGSVAHLAGPNEPNSSQSDTWPQKLESMMADLRAARDAHLPDAILAGWGAKHEHVRDYDGDLVKARPSIRHVDEGWLAFHYYCYGDGGPTLIAAELDRAVVGYGAPVGIHEETGYNDDQTPPAVKARMEVETLLRNFVSGIALTNLYMLTDDPNGGGAFGVLGKPAEVSLQQLLATQDGREAFVGRLSHADDCAAVVTSDGGGEFTVYLLRAANQTATLVLDPAYQADSGGYVLGDAGNKRYSVGLVETMTTVKVTPA